MIFYTSDPLECLIPNQESGEPVTLRLPSGALINAVVDESRQLRIVNVVSTDPQDYLNSKYQPGRLVSLQPDFES